MSTPNPYDSTTESNAREAEPEPDPLSARHNPILRSFLAIILGIMTFVLVGFGGHALVVVVLFPDQVAVLQEIGKRGRQRENPPAEQAQDQQPADEQKQNDPQPDPDAEKKDPPAQASDSFWIAGLTTYCLAALSAGIVTAAVANYGRIGHGLLLAAFLFFSSLRRGGDDVLERPAWALMAFAVGVPLAAMIGAWCVERYSAPTKPLPEE